MDAAIETVGLTKRFAGVRGLRDVILGRPGQPDRVAVGDVDLQIGRGEVFGLLGQNGAGKSTLVRMLTTLLLPTSGSARVDGLDIERDARAIRSRVGLISGDERSFYWRLTGRQNLEFFGALRHLDPIATADGIERLAGRLGMAEHLDRPFGRLSSGQRQALAIIRGLLDQPSILFMDEPTRSLDPISAVRLRQFVADVVVGELERTVVIATHSMPEAEALCDRVAFIQDGRIVAAGSVTELRRAIGYGTRCELRLGPIPDGLLGRLASVPMAVALTSEGVPDGAQDRAAVVIRVQLGGSQVLDRLLKIIVEAGVAVIACETGELSLEEIYVRTLGTPSVAQPSGIPVPAR